MAGLRTEYPFVLPKGYVDGDGVVHREGRMRLATARDELEPLSDPRVENADDPRLTVIVLSRVITRLGTIERLSPRDVEDFFAADLAHLQDVYSAINYGSAEDIARVTGEAVPTAGLEAEAAPADANASDGEGEDAAPLEKEKPRGRRARIEEVGKSRSRPGGSG